MSFFSTFLQTYNITKDNVTATLIIRDNTKKHEIRSKIQINVNVSAAPPSKPIAKSQALLDIAIETLKC